MVLIWSGAGILVPIIWFACYFAVALVVGAFTPPGYWEAHNWPKLAGCWLAAPPIGLLGLMLNAPSETEADAPRGNHSFFFIPMELWSLVMIVLGIGLLFL